LNILLVLILPNFYSYIIHLTRLVSVSQDIPGLDLGLSVLWSHLTSLWQALMMTTMRRRWTRPSTRRAIRVTPARVTSTMTTASRGMHTVISYDTFHAATFQDQLV